MKIPESDYQIVQLSDDFYHVYKSPPNEELLKKNNRPYTCLLFQTHYDFFICIPYRTEITHFYAYRFKKSSRSQKHKSGLDYTKRAIINNNKFIDDKTVVIDKDEYNETIKAIQKIKQDALKYVEDYIAHINGNNLLAHQEFNRRYTYSTLKYFHNELGI